MTTARTLAERIEHDLRRRKGIGDEWDEIDPEIQDEIIEAIEVVVESALADAYDRGYNTGAIRREAP